jgi:polyisoprenoid-binding protein YceI
MKRLFSISLLLTVFIFAGYAQTPWKIDPAHSNIDFSVRYMMLSNVRGSFGEFHGVLTQRNDDFSGSEVEIRIRTASINTNNTNRDNHLRSDDFFNAEEFPDIVFVTREFTKTGDTSYLLLGDLTIRNVTRPVELTGELIGIADDPRGFKRAAFTGQTTIRRDDFDVRWNQALETGGFMVGNDVTITVNAQFTQ